MSHQPATVTDPFYALTAEQRARAEQLHADAMRWRDAHSVQLTPEQLHAIRATAAGMAQGKPMALASCSDDDIARIERCAPAHPELAALLTRARTDESLTGCSQPWHAAVSFRNVALLYCFAVDGGPNS